MITHFKNNNNKKNPNTTESNSFVMGLFIAIPFFFLFFSIFTGASIDVTD